MYIVSPAAEVARFFYGLRMVFQKGIFVVLQNIYLHVIVN